jgi:3'(2'), 5'-bisphosphate nucleotidase
MTLLLCRLVRVPVALSLCAIPLATRSAAFVAGSSFSSPTQQRRQVSLCVNNDIDHHDNNNNLQSVLELPIDFPRREDVLIALDAVRRACRVAQKLQPELVDNADSSSALSIGTILKQDSSPVTVADYAVQAVVLSRLQEAFFSDGFIAEEDSVSLQADHVLCEQVMQASDGIFFSRQPALQDAIDLGRSYTEWTSTDNDNATEGQKRPRRVWCLDPIDGTKGFLRGRRNGGQYCIALALLEDGIPTIGILGCPNLPTGVNDEDFAWRDDETADNNPSTRGCVFVSSLGGGSYQLPLIANADKGIRLQATVDDGSVRAVSDARFCIGVERYSDALGQW